MKSAVETIAVLLPKLSPADRRKVRCILDKEEHATWQRQTEKFRRLMRGKARDRRPASTVVSEGRR